jgi:transposase
MRRQQATAAWKHHYDVRAGIEGTLLQGISAFGLRHARYLGQAKMYLQHILVAAAINVVRVVTWLNDIPHAKTRISRFAALAATE